MVKKFEDIFIRFGATHERDGQTDRRTIAALCIASHGKNRSGGFVPWANFYQKFEIFANFSYLSRYFYTDNVEISLKRRQTWESIKKNKFSSESLKGPTGITLPSGGDAY